MIRMMPAMTLAVLLCVAGVVFGAEKKEGAFTNLEVEGFEKLIAEKDVVVLDVRTAREVAGGKIAGSVNIDWNAKDFNEQVGKMDKDKKYAVYCAASVRSPKACARMESLGFIKVYNLLGGFRAWEKAGKGVEK